MVKNISIFIFPTVVQGVPWKTSNIFRIDRTRLEDQGFPYAIFLQILFFQFYYILKDDFNK